MVSLKHKVTLKTKVAQEETPEAIKGSKVSLKKKQPVAPISSASMLKGRTEPIPVSQISQVEKKLNKVWNIVGIAAVVVIIIGAFFFINNGKENRSGNDNTPTEMIAQNREKQEATDDASVTDTSNEEFSEEDCVSVNESEDSTPASAEEKPAAKEAKSTSAIVTDNEEVEQAARQNPTSTTEIAKTAASQTIKLTTSSNLVVGGNIEEMAYRVIRGDFGNGQERKDKLGDSYSEIQGKVNEMYRLGLVF